MTPAKILSLAWRNIFRQRARSVATLAAIAIGVTGLILAGGFVKDIFIQLGEAIIHSQTGHIQVTLNGYREGKTKEPEKFLIKNPDDLKSRITKAASGIKLTTSRLGFSGILNNGKRDLGIIGEGIEIDSENTIGTHLNYIEGGALKKNDVDAMVIGEGAAKSLGLKVGDHVTLVVTLAAGAVNTIDLKIAGVFQSFSKDFDAHAIRIPLAAAMELMDTKSAHVIVVLLSNTADTTATVSALRRYFSADDFEVLSWIQLSDFYEKTIDLYERQFGVLRLIILVMVLLSVINSVNMSLFERTREFGSMRAIGDRSTAIFQLVVAESFCLGAIGATLGMLLGCGAAIAISAIGIPMPPPPNANLGYTALIRLDASSVVIAGCIGFFACIIAAFIPARRASRLDIVDALRHGI
jgi:putative ABC transport system permease protein